MTKDVQEIFAIEFKRLQGGLVAKIGRASCRERV